jgi:hypothetical protein
MTGRALLLCIVSVALLAARDPFAGVWNLNLAQSKLPPPVPKSRVVRIEADAGSISIREEVVGEKGEQMTMTVTANYSGTDASGKQVTGTAVFDRFTK